MYCVDVLESIFNIKLHKKTYIEDRVSESVLLKNTETS